MSDNNITDNNNGWGNASQEVILACCKILKMLRMHREQGYNEFPQSIFDELEVWMNTVKNSGRSDLVEDCKPMYDVIKRECTPLILYRFKNNKDDD